MLSCGQTIHDSFWTVLCPRKRLIGVLIRECTMSEKIGRLCCKKVEKQRYVCFGCAHGGLGRKPRDGKCRSTSNARKIAYTSQRLADNSKDFLGYLEHVTAHAGSQSAPFYQVPSQTPAPTISPEIIAMITMRNQNPIPTTFTLVPSISSKSNSRLGKLLDIPEYNGDMEKLGAWEQLIIQRMRPISYRYG